MDDHKRTIKPGETVKIDAAGQFVYCKYASSDWRLLIGGAPTGMQSGDLRREPAGFEYVEAHNPTGKPVSVILVIGQGQFERKAIQGEISVLAGIRRAGGVFSADARYWRELTLNWSDFNIANYEAEGLIAYGGFDSYNVGQHGGWVDGQEVFIAGDNSEGRVEVRDVESGELLRQSTYGVELGVAIPWAMNKLRWVSHDKVDGEVLFLAVEKSPTQKPNKYWIYRYSLKRREFVGEEDKFSLFPGLESPDNSSLMSIARDAISGKYIAHHQRAGITLNGQSQSTIVIYSASGEVEHIIYKPFSSIGNKGVIYTSKIPEAGSADWYVMDGPGAPIYYDRREILSGRLVEVDGPQGSNAQRINAFCVADPDRYCMHSWQSGYYKVAMENHTVSGKAYATRKPEKIVMPTSRKIYGEFAALGEGYASGPIISAALQAYGYDVPKNYLDRVFRLDIEPGIGRQMQTVINAGNESFLSKELVDDFEVELPLTMRIYTDL